jgi:hypothetical protein
MVVPSKGRGGLGFSITEFLAKCKKLQSHCKATAKKTAKLPNPSLPMICFVFVFCFCSFAVIEKCIQKTGGSGLGRGRGRVGV